MHVNHHTPEYMDWYHRRCADAIREEKLDLVSAALERAGVEHQIDQTGGFVMVLRVTHAEGTYTVTRDDEEPDSFLCVWWPGDSFHTGDDEATNDLFWTVHIEGLIPFLAAGIKP